MSMGHTDVSAGADTTKSWADAPEVTEEELMGGPPNEPAQMNVRIRRNLLWMARRLARRRGLSLTKYIESLIAQDIERERDDFQKTFKAQLDRAKVEEEKFRQDLESAYHAVHASRGSK